MLCLDCVTDNNGEIEMVALKMLWDNTHYDEHVQYSKGFVRDQMENYLRCPSRETEQYLIEAIRDHTQLSKH